MFDNYMEEIENPMCIMWVMEKIRKSQYNNKDEFIRDVEQIFKNCFEFNEADSEIYQSAR
jgi:vacuolar-type H+-ATPase catalytic subunit A/Vma1